MRRTRITLAALGLAGAMLAGCGDDGDAPPDPAPTVEPEGSEPPAETDSPTDDGPTTSVATTVAPPLDPSDPDYPQIEPRPDVTYPASAPG